MVINTQHQVLKILFQLTENQTVHVVDMQRGKKIFLLGAKLANEQLYW